jgi:hypothetical protein
MSEGNMQITLKLKPDSKAIQLFSGEGESLILASLLVEAGIVVDGLFVVGKYGIEWELDKVAQKRWTKCEQKGELHILIQDCEDTTCLWSFEHGFHYHERNIDSFWYENEDVFRWLVNRDYTDIIMGFRRSDFQRHIRDIDKQKRAELTADYSIKNKGFIYPCYLCDFKIWWPLYWMAETQKEQMLNQLCQTRKC